MDCAFLALLDQPTELKTHDQGPVELGGCCLAPFAVNGSRKMQLFVYKLRLVIVLEASDSGAHRLAENIVGRKIMCEA